MSRAFEAARGSRAAGAYLAACLRRFATLLTRPAPPAPLNAGVYTRRIGARILDDHLLVAGTPTQHIRALVEGGKIAKVVDHANHNPRVVG
jgi:hypothetical protein